MHLSEGLEAKRLTALLVRVARAQVPERGLFGESVDEEAGCGVSLHDGYGERNKGRCV